MTLYLIGVAIGLFFGFIAGSLRWRAVANSHEAALNSLKAKGDVESWRSLANDLLRQRAESREVELGK